MLVDIVGAPLYLSRQIRVRNTGTKASVVLSLDLALAGRSSHFRLNLQLASLDVEHAIFSRFYNIYRRLCAKAQHCIIRAHAFGRMTSPARGILPASIYSRCC